MTTGSAIDLGTTVAGVRLPFRAMNASGVWSSTVDELRALARSRVGALVLRTATLHPFIHPAYRSLHNPGYDKLLPLVRELVAGGEKPVVASIAGATADEYAILARAFADAGAAWVEANFADPYVTVALAPFESPEGLFELAARLVKASAVPVAVKLPDLVPLPFRLLGQVLAEAGVRVVVARNEFTGLEKLLLEAGPLFAVIAAGGIRSGYDVSRALAKGAAAVQVNSALATEGPAIFARLEREMRIARGVRDA